MRFYDFAPLLVSTLAVASSLASDLGAGRANTVLSRRTLSSSHNAVVKESSLAVERRDTRETFVDGLKYYFKTLPKRSNNPHSTKRNFGHDLECWLECDIPSCPRGCKDSITKTKPPR